MGLSLQTNIAAMDTTHNLDTVQSQLSNTMEQLSSGYKINTAADNAAGMAISEVMQSQISGLNQAASNAADGSNMIQTAAGGMQQIQSMFQSMRQLAVQASNSTLGATDTAAIATQLTDLQNTINNIATSTQFNGQNVLDGSLSTSLATTGTASVGLTVGGGSITSINASGAEAGTTYTLSTSAGGLTLTNGTSGQSQTLSAAQLATVAGSLGAGGSGTVNFGQMGVSIGLGATNGGAGITAANLVALGTAGDTIKTTAGAGAASLQVGANDAADNTLTVAFNNMQVVTGNTDGTTGTNLSALATALSTYTGNGGQTTANAQSLISAVDSAIGTVSTVQSNLGASQNALTFVTQNLNTTSENLSASNSAIVDVDVAEATSNMSRQNVLMQAGISVLSQANQEPQMALKLLQ